MDEIDWEQFKNAEWGNFRWETKRGGRVNWFADEVGSGIRDWQLFLEELKAGTPRAQAYLAQIIAWRMNRGDT